MRFIFNILFFIVGIFFFMSCAAPRFMLSKTNGTIDVAYAVPQNYTVAINIEPLTVGGAIRDANIVGEAKVGLFNTSKPIYSDEPMNTIVKSMLVAAFSKARFSVVEKERADILLSGQIERFWVDEYATGWSPEYSKAHVSFDIIIKNKDGAFIWGGTVEGASKSVITIVDTTTYDIETLLTALQGAVSSLFRDRTFWKSLLREARRSH